MLALDTATVFFGASVLLALSPGPDNVFVLTNSSIAGARAGVLVTLGLCTGLLVHTALVGLGVAAVVTTSDVAFAVLRAIGAVYLLYLAWGALRAGAVDIASDGDAVAQNWYVRGIVLNVSNPKVAVFFIAFLPQFIAPQQNALLQTVQLGALFILSTLLVFGGIALLAGRLGERLRRAPRAQLWLNRAAAMVFLALAVRLLLLD